jgi:hypothetical protein
VKWSEKLGQGFVELVEHLPTDGHPDHNGIGLLVRIDHDKLTGQLSSAGVLPGGADLDAGTRISARDARRLACNAGIIPAVLGGKSQPPTAWSCRASCSGWVLPGAEPGGGGLWHPEGQWNGLSRLADA